MIASSIKKLTLLEAEQIASDFSGCNFHQWQDPVRSVYISQPCFVCSIDGRIIAFAVLQINRFKRASLWFGPYILDGADMNVVIVELFKCLKQEGIWYFIFQPENDFISDSVKVAIQKHKVHLRNTSNGWGTAIKNIEQPDELLLKSYSQNHRYCINRAKKNGIVVSVINAQIEFDELLRVFHLMYAQRNIHYYSDDLSNRLNGEFKFINDFGKGNVFVAKKDGKILGGIVLLYSNDSAFYLNGAMDKNESLPVMYAVLDYAILYVKNKGIKTFDFGGYLTDESDKQFLAVNRFKNGFNIQVHQYPDKLIIGINFIKGFLIESLLFARNKILRLRRKHVS